jgi:hypothetical protein
MWRSQPRKSSTRATAAPVVAATAAAAAKLKLRTIHHFSKSLHTQKAVVAPNQWICRTKYALFASLLE